MSKKSIFQNLCSKIEEIAMLYFKAKRKRCEDNNDEKYDQYIHLVMSSYGLLDDVDKTFINNEFFFEKYHFWWIDRYSKSSYYRYKKKAMKNFLRNYRCLKK